MGVELVRGWGKTVPLERVQWSSPHPDVRLPCKRHCPGSRWGFGLLNPFHSQGRLTSIHFFFFFLREYSRARSVAGSLLGSEDAPETKTGKGLFMELTAG